MDDDQVRALAETRGISLGYHDALGQWREPSVEVLRAILDDLGEAPPADALTLVADHRAPIRTPDTWRGGHVECEDGREIPLGEWLPGPLPAGYHHIRRGTERAPLFVPPERAFLPERLAGGGHGWGVAAQLYAVRGAGSWGIGDVADLARLPAALGDPDFVLINPLHAPTAGAAPEPSPYFAGSRRFRNPLHLCLPASPEVAGLLPDERAEFAALDATGRALNASPTIDRGPIWTVKRAALTLLLAALRRTPDRATAFRRFQDTTPGLSAFARFNALAEHHGTPDWRTWGPPPPDAVLETEIHAYAQFLIEEQLAAFPALPLGLMTDLAVGTDRAGFDAWAHQDIVSARLRVGAPPDPLGPEGQDWGVPPWLPTGLERHGYRPFIDMVRAAMAHAGGLRIDHAMGLARLYVIPEGAGAVEGTYLRMPIDALLAIIRIESHRARCMVVGEDLGTVEDGFRERMDRAGVLSYRLAWFEDRPPSEYPRRSMAAVTTHDLPTVAGFFSGADMAHLRDIRALAPDLLNEIAERQPAERDRLRERLAAAGAPGSHSDDPARITTALGHLVSRTPSMLRCASLDDLCGATLRANVPGTTDQRPNWRIPLPMTLEAIAAAPGVRDGTAPLRQAAAPRRAERPPAC